MRYIFAALVIVVLFALGSLVTLQNNNSHALVSSLAATETAVANQGVAIYDACTVTPANGGVVGRAAPYTATDLAGVPGAGTLASVTPWQNHWVCVKTTGAGIYGSDVTEVFWDGPPLLVQGQDQANISTAQQSMLAAGVASRMISQLADQPDTLVGIIAPSGQAIPGTGGTTANGLTLNTLPPAPMSITMLKTPASYDTPMIVQNYVTTQPGNSKVGSTSVLP